VCCNPLRPKIDVTAIGNAIVDVISVTDDAFLDREGIKKGSMNLIEGARANQLYNKMTSPVTACGGSAANTVVGLSDLGAGTAFIGKVKNDEAGLIFQQGMVDNGIIYKTVPSNDPAETARCLVFVTPDAQRSMNTHLGASINLSESDIEADLVVHSRVLYLEGYLWDPPGAKAAFLKAITLAKNARTKVALSLSDAFCVKRHRPEFRDLVANHVDILFANEEEIISLYEAPDFDTATTAARKDCDLLALTRDARGSVVIRGETVIAIAAEYVPNVVDTTGAGDLYAAGFLYGFISDMNLRMCGTLGGLAAAQIITHFGARPEASLKQLIAKVSAGA